MTNKKYFFSQNLKLFILFFLSLNSIKGLSTFPFRKAIRLYIQNIFGYTHYDADYKTEVYILPFFSLTCNKVINIFKQMNALLPIPLKTFLKLTVK